MVDFLQTIHLTYWLGCLQQTDLDVKVLPVLEALEGGVSSFPVRGKMDKSEAYIELFGLDFVSTLRISGSDPLI